MSFFERFKGPSHSKQETPDIKAALAENQAARLSFEASLADVENLDLVRERAGLEVELEMKNFKPLSEQRLQQISQRMQEIDTTMKRARNEAVRKAQN